MSSIIQKYYSIKPILETDANYYLIFGEKSNGKSYQVKHEVCVKHYLKTGKRFILLRRWREDITTLWVEKYFSNVDVHELTDGKYDCISVYKQELYFSIVEEGKTKPKPIEKIGYVMALSTEQHMSSADFTDCDVIVYEEFMDRKLYIHNECNLLMTFYSTIDRKRGVTKLFFVGNTITRTNPYIYEWGLQPIVRKMKQGDIVTTKIKTSNEDEEDQYVKIALEYCESSGGRKTVIGQAKSMIDSGAWQTDIQPHLPKSKKEYDVLFRIGFSYQGFKFLGELLEDKITGKVVWFIFPKYNDFYKNTIIFTDEVKLNDDYYYQRNIYDITLPNKKIQEVLNYFRQTTLFFSDDLCGTDFKQCIDFQIRR